MKSLPLLALLLTFIASPYALGQAKIDPSKLKHPVKACLFKVEGNGLEKPCWLFGTIHLGMKNVTTLHPNAEAAFVNADAVYTEIDLDPASQMAMAPMMIRKDGKTLTQALGPELTAQSQQALTNINPALKISAFDSMKTWVFAISLPILELQLKNQKALDVVLYNRAQQDKKIVGALETAASQIALFDQFSETEIQAMLADTLRTLKEDEAAEVTSVTRLLNTYLSGDIYKIGEFLKAEMAKMNTDEDFNKRFIKALLDDRNVGMANKADEIMKKNPANSCFFAVGAGHYTGETAVQKYLIKKGYKVTETFE